MLLRPFVPQYSKEGSHEIRNGLLLRADFHRLFDIVVWFVLLRIFVSKSAPKFGRLGSMERFTTA
ncbi:MAG: HNH endonuclease [Propionivibrio sp.]|nr:HNH endonuclease [Propionivibrio sp.]